MAVVENRFNVWPRSMHSLVSRVRLGFLVGLCLISTMFSASAGEFSIEERIDPLTDAVVRSLVHYDEYDGICTTTTLSNSGNIDLTSMFYECATGAGVPPLVQDGRVVSQFTANLNKQKLRVAPQVGRYANEVSISLAANPDHYWGGFPCIGHGAEIRCGEALVEFRVAYELSDGRLALVVLDFTDPVFAEFTAWWTSSALFDQDEFDLLAKRTLVKRQGEQEHRDADVTDDAHRATDAPPVTNPDAGWMEKLAAQIRDCMSVPLGAAEEGAIALLEVTIGPDGTVENTPIILKEPTSTLEQQMTQAALRAVMRCGPYAWLGGRRTIRMTFDPRLF